MFNKETLEHFWDKVDVRGPNDCWEWNKHRDSHGYGRYNVPKYAAIMLKITAWKLSHRVAYCLGNNCVMKDIDDVQVLHSCDNPPCCNPRHLYTGTTADRTRMSVMRGRHPNNFCSTGDRNYNARLTNHQILEIRDRYDGLKSNRPTLEKIGEKYGVTLVTIGRVLSRVTWKHI